MHHSIIGTSGMDQDSHLAQDHSYSNENWGVDMNPYSQNTMPDYGNFGYGPSVTHGLPSESMNRMPPPPQPIQPQQQSHPQLPMLIMPSHATWPSMLTNPNSYSAPPLAIPPVAATPSKPLRLPSVQQSQPRRTLTDDDRRRMCKYHEEHPQIKQTEIGAMFGVERSTVSKVLRNKEKYLFPEDRSQSPIKRTKGKFPDIDRALSAWAKKTQQSGGILTDAEIWEKARHFAHGLGPNSDSHIKGLSSSWLEKFKQKNGLGPGKLMRRASETNVPDHAKLSSASPSLGPSPASPTGHPSPLSADRSDEDTKDGLGFMGFATEGGYKHSNSQSTTSLSSAFTDTAASSFSGSALSPTAPFTFSPDPNVGSFLPTDQSRHLHGGVGSNFQRPRSQTFPTLDLEYMNQTTTSEPLTPKYQPAATAPSSALESPVHEMNAPPFGLDNAISSPPHLHHSSSNGSMAGRATTTPATGAMASTPVGSSPTSPTQEDACRAADTLLNFIQSAGPSAFVDQHDYLAVVRLTEKLRLNQLQTAKAGGPAVQSLGGLSRIPEGDSEMSSVSSAMGMKVEATMSG